MHKIDSTFYILFCCMSWLQSTETQHQDQNDMPILFLCYDIIPLACLNPMLFKHKVLEALFCLVASPISIYYSE